VLREDSSKIREDSFAKRSSEARRERPISWKMTRSIGFRSKRSDALSREILMNRTLSLLRPLIGRGLRRGFIADIFQRKFGVTISVNSASLLAVSSF